MKIQIQAGAQPWKTEFDRLQGSSFASRGPHGLSNINSRTSDAEISRDDAAVRHGNDKLMTLGETGAVELYELSNDVAETNDVAGSNKKKVNRLKAELENWKSQLKAPKYDRLGTWDPAKTKGPSK